MAKLENETVSRIVLTKDEVSKMATSLQKIEDSWARIIVTHDVGEQTLSRILCIMQGPDGEEEVIFVIN